MKKYLAAGAVAVMVFAFAAMAASLNVDGGVLQAGSADDLTCTENVEVDFTGFEGDLLDPSNDFDAVVGGGFTTMTLTGLEDCDGTDVYTRIFDNDGAEIWRSVPIPSAANSATQAFSDGDVENYTLLSASSNQNPGTVIRSEDIARVDVQIDG